MRDLTEIRQEIDEIDKKMVELFEARLRLVSQVAEYKINVQKPVLDKVREQEKLMRLCEMAETDFSQKGINELFAQIMAICRKRQYQLMNEMGIAESSGFLTEGKLPVEGARIVYQGVEGAYSQMAMQAYFGENADSFHVDTWRDAMEAITKGNADYAVLPIENSSAGIVGENCDLLLEYGNYIVGEQTIKVEHALLGLQEAELSDITCVYSHPQALSQCVDFLDEHREWERVNVKNTAGAAKKVLDDGLKNQAAISSLITAEIYGLKVLGTAVNYSETNSTRFIVVAGRKLCLEGARKISISFEVPHESGSLYQMLSHFIYNDLNMDKIESRPIKDKSFEYRFYVEFEGNLNEAAVQNAIKGLMEEARNVRVLGNY